MGTRARQRLAVARTRPAQPLIRCGVIAFAIGLVAIAVTFIGYAAGAHNRPLWQNLLCLLAPFGFALALTGLVRDGRADARRIAARYPAQAEAIPTSEGIGGRDAVAAALRWTAIVEATSWLLLIAATVIKYAADYPAGVQIMGPVHGVLFLVYLALTAVAWPVLGWPVRTVLVVLIDSVLPGGGFVVARRHDLRPVRVD